mgnify:CR=1 FL=1
MTAAITALQSVAGASMYTNTAHGQPPLNATRHIQSTLTAPRATLMHALPQDRLIAHAKEQIARWQAVIQQQEQLQEATLFAGLGS